jgi:hypothetical protein
MGIIDQAGPPGGDLPEGPTVTYEAEVQPDPSSNKVALCPLALVLTTPFSLEQLTKANTARGGVSAY